jgi:SNF2 family DNA or RNA helicase
MPRVTRKVISVDMDKEQAKLYKELDHDKFTILPSGMLLVTATSLEESIRLRQILICPKVIDPSFGYGAAFNAYLEMLEDAEEEDDRHTVIFCPFKSPFPFWREELVRRKIPVFQLSGGISPEEQQRQIVGFRERKGVMLCTARYAEAFSLAPATASYFIGQEWDPNVCAQAEDRLLPQEGTNPISAFYYAHKGTVEPRICEYLDAQQRVIDLTLGAGHGT